MTKAKIGEVIAQAKSWLGCNEQDGSYRQIIDAYNAIGNGIPMDYSWPWCCCFVSAVYFKALGEKRFAEIACDRQINILKQLGLYSLTGKPAIGDLIYYDWNSDGATDHVGILAEIDGNAWTVIEGNKSDAVSYRTISPSYAYIRGFGFVTKLFERDEDEKPKAESAPATVGQQMAEKIITSRDWPTLKLGSKGEWVVVLQALLNAKFKSGLEVDGDYGPLTFVAVNKAQNKFALERDGITGPQTWGVLKK